MPDGHVVEVPIFLTAPRVVTTNWPGARSMGTSFVGRLTLGDGSTVWVVSLTRPAQPHEVTAWTDLQGRMSQKEKAKKAATAYADLRAVIIGDLADDGSRWFLDLLFTTSPQADPDLHVL
jgi:hypothetical protein